MTPVTDSQIIVTNTKPARGGRYKKSMAESWSSELTKASQLEPASVIQHSILSIEASQLDQASTVAVAVAVQYSHNQTHQCKTCEKIFTRSCHLKRHQRIHSGERPFECKTCGKMFKQSAHLKTHQRTHSGEKPFRCDICDYKFIQSSDLKRHERIHTGEKPYQCGTCGRRFAQSTTLVRHQCIHTRDSVK